MIRISCLLLILASTGALVAHDVVFLGEPQEGFTESSQNTLRRGIFRDVEELILAIGDYIDQHNDDPKPIVWTAKAPDVLEKVKRARAALVNR